MEKNKMILSIINKIETNLLSFDNNSLLVRYLLAFLVFYSHMFAIYGLKEPTLLFGNHSLGWYAVNGFFLISGVLVGQSFYKRSFKTYCISRSLRILPGYIFSLIFTIMIIIIFDNIVLTNNYILQYLYFLTYNLLPLSEITHAGISGVWVNSGLSSVLNTSLWTIPFEIFGYLFIIPFLLTKVKLIYKVLLIIISFYFLLHLDIISNGNIKYDLLRVLIYFAIGISFFMYIKDKKLNLYLPFLISILFIFEGSLIETLMGYIVIISILYFGFYLNSIITFNNDYSYGWYLYAFPISQAVNGGGNREYLYSYSYSFLLFIHRLIHKLEIFRKTFFKYEK